VPRQLCCFVLKVTREENPGSHNLTKITKGHAKLSGCISDTVFDTENTQLQVWQDDFSLLSKN
jgi:hypothetical protein